MNDSDDTKSASEERQARWAKAEKERGPKNGEIVRDKFPQAFKERVLNRGKDSETTPEGSKLRNSDGTAHKMVDDFSKIRRWSVK